MNIQFFDDKIGKFIHSLEESTVARVLRTIDLLETFGNKLGSPHSKKIGSRLFELRIRGKQGVRIFYTFHGGGIILLRGFIKKSQKIPVKEIRTARDRLNMLDTQ